MRYGSLRHRIYAVMDTLILWARESDQRTYMPTSPGTVPQEVTDELAAMEAAGLVARKPVPEAWLAEDDWKRDGWDVAWFWRLTEAGRTEHALLNRSA